MSKTTRNLLLGLGALVILIGVMLLLQYAGTDNADDPSSGTTSTEFISLYELKKTKLDTVVIENTTGSYQFNKSGEDSFSIAKFDGLDVKTDAIDSQIGTALSLKANEVIEESATNLAQYGLVNAQAVVTLLQSDAEAVSFSVGDKAADGTGYYLAMKDETKVYLVSSTYVSGYLKAETDYLNLSVVPAATEDEPVTVSQLTLHRADLAKPITLVADKDESEAATYSSGYRITSPVEAQMKTSDEATAFLNGLIGLTADKAVTANPTEEALASAGLTEPTATLLVQTDTTRYEFLIGDALPDGSGMRYGMLTGKNVLFAFAESSLPWLTTGARDIMSTLIVTPFIYNLSSLEVTIGSRKEVFAVEGEDNDTAVFTHNGQALDGDLFRSFYQFVVSVPAEEINEDVPQGNPVASFRYVYDDAAKGAELVEFYDGGTRSLIISLNGKPYYRVRTAYLDRLEGNLDNLLAGEEMIENW